MPRTPPGLKNPPSYQKTKPPPRAHGQWPAGPRPGRHGLDRPGSGTSGRGASERWRGEPAGPDRSRRCPFRAWQQRPWQCRADRSGARGASRRGGLASVGPICRRFGRSGRRGLPVVDGLEFHRGYTIGRRSGAVGAREDRSGRAEREEGDKDHPARGAATRSGRPSPCRRWACRWTASCWPGRARALASFLTLQGQGHGSPPQLAATAHNLYAIMLTVKAASLTLWV